MQGSWHPVRTCICFLCKQRGQENGLLGNTHHVRCGYTENTKQPLAMTSTQSSCTYQIFYEYYNFCDCFFSSASTSCRLLPYQRGCPDLCWLSFAVNIHRVETILIALVCMEVCSVLVLLAQKILLSLLSTFVRCAPSVLSSDAPAACFSPVAVRTVTQFF